MPSIHSLQTQQRHISTSNFILVASYSTKGVQKIESFSNAPIVKACEVYGSLASVWVRMQEDLHNSPVRLCSNACGDVASQQDVSHHWEA